MDSHSADVPAAVVPPAYSQHDNAGPANPQGGQSYQGSQNSQDSKVVPAAPPASGVRQRNTESSGSVKKSRSSAAAGAVAESAERQVRGVVGIASEAVSSGAWAYPIRGALYIVSHPKLIGPVLPLLLRALAISAGVVAGCFFFLYLPQVAWLALFTGPLAFLAAVPLVLGEAYVIIMFIGKNFLFGQLSTDLFDAVMVQKGHAALVEKHRAVTTRSTGGRQLGRVLTRPLSKLSTDNIVRYLLTLPLNLIPVVGTVFFLGYNGYKAGPSCHARYFQLKGWDKSRRANFVRKRRGAYTAFGVVSMLFNMVPVVGVVLSMASSVGSALWASDLEGKSPTQADEVEVTIPSH